MPETLTPDSLAQLQTWVGRTASMDDTITHAPLRALAATLDLAPAPPATLPALWHWLYFLPHAAQREIGPDGHARRGGFLPPVPLPRRMWAGGQLEWQAANPLCPGQAVTRESRIASVEAKQGRSGAMVFVKVEHRIHNPHGLALTEWQDIVFREPPVAGEPPPAPTPAEAGAPWQREWTPDEVMLFRYSALTFNGHRIHYDRPYATAAEGYPGLVVHGPLIATLLAALVREHRPDAALASFRFRALRPTFDGRPLRVNGRAEADGTSVRLWAQDHDGCLTMSAEATLA